MHHHQTPARLALCAGLASFVAAQDFAPATFLQTNQVQFGSFYRRDLNNNGQPDLVIEVLSGPDAGFYTMLDPGMTSTTATLTTAFLALNFDIFGGLPQNMGFADMNADGFEDLVVEFESVFSGGSILMLPGDGQGGFGAAVTLATAGGFTTTTLGDFDGNGEMDFAFVNGPSVDIHLQTSGTFQLALSIPGGFPRSMVAGDFDGDGDDDLSLNYNGSMIVQPGGPTFGAQLTFAVEPRLNFGYAQDLDQDGYEDLVLQASSSPPWLVNAFFGDPTTMLTVATDVYPGGGPNGSNYIGPFDVDADGNDELLATIRNTSGYFLIRHDGARGFSPEPYGTLMTGGLIDLDMDGDLDQLVPDPAGGGYRRLENLALYGTACSGSAGLPVLDIGSAIPGNANFAVTVGNAAPSALCALFVSQSGQPGPCGPQVDLGQLYFPALLAVTDGTGLADYALPLPADLLEGPFLLQAAVLDPAGALPLAGLSWATTEGRTLRVY